MSKLVTQLQRVLPERRERRSKPATNSAAILRRMARSKSRREQGLKGCRA